MILRGKSKLFILFTKNCNNVQFLTIISSFFSRGYHQIMLRTVRDAANPFELSERTFVRYFRLTRVAARELINVIAPFGDTRNIPFDLAVLGSLMFLGKGSYQKNIGISSLYSVSQPTVSRNLHQIVGLIVTHVLPAQVRFPESDNDFRRLIREFQLRFGEAMPEVWGVIDGSLIAIHTPPIHSRRFPARVYRCRKGYSAINVLFISAANGRFLYVNARFPGSVHDSAIFRTSLARLRLVTEFQTTGRNRGVLLGDQGFGLEPWILPPIGAPVNGPAQIAFNRSHKIVRMSVENHIGLLKTVFRCLLKDRVLHYSPTFSGQLIYAATTLHNFRISHNVTAAADYDGTSSESSDDSLSGSDSDTDEIEPERDPEDPNVRDPEDPNVHRNQRRHPGDLFTEEGERVRQRYIRNHFFNRI